MVRVGRQIPRRSPGHGLNATTLLTVTLLAALGPDLAWAASAAAVTRVADGRHRKTADPVPAKLRGVITAFSGWKNSFFLQDGTGGISVDRLEDTPASVGDEVEVSGQLRPGLFAPVVVSDQVRVMAHRELPSAHVANYGELVHGQLDSQLVEVSGVVHAARIGEVWGRKVLFLDLHTSGGVITVHVLDFPDRKFDYLIDSTVRVRGVCGTIFNDRRQLVGLRLFVPQLAISMVVTPATDPALLPISPLDSLMTFDGQPPEHRQKVTGTVTYATGTEIYLQQGRTAIRLQSERPGKWPIGTRLNAWGFVDSFAYLLTLRHALVEQASGKSAAEPIRVAASGVIKSESGFTQAPYNGLLVNLQGNVAELLPGTQKLMWLARDGNVSFQIEVNARQDDSRVVLEPGTRVDVTGICIAEADENQALKSFRILLRSPGDIRVLKATYWNSSFWLLAALLLLIFLSGSASWLFLRWHRPSGMEDLSEGTAARLRPPFQRISRLLAGVACLSGVLVVAAWTWNAGFLHVQTGGRTPVPNVGVAVLAAASALFANRRPGWPMQAIRSIAAGLTTAIGALTLLEYLSSTDFGIDGLLIQHAGNIPALSSGRMPIATALCLLLIGVAIFLVRHRRLAGVGQVLAIGAGVIGLLNVINSLYGDEAAYGPGAHATLAPATALGLILLSLAVLFSEPDCGVMEIISLSGTGGLMARRLLPVAIVVPIVLGWIRLQGQLAGLYDTRFGLALFAMSNITCFGFVIWGSASILNNLDGARSRAEKALRERDRRLEGVFETASVGDWIWDPEKDEVTAHPVVWKLYGAPGRFGSAAADWFRTRQHPEDAALFERDFHAAIEQRRQLDVEVRALQPDGALRWLSCRGTPVYDNAGKILRMDGINFDITARKLAELQVKKNEMLLRQLADAMPQIVWTARSDGRIDYCNQRWYDYSGLTTAAMPWQQSIHPDDFGPCKREWARCVASQSPYQMEVRLKRSDDGCHRWHLVRSIPVQGAQGETERWFGTATDIDDFKHAGSALRALNEDLERKVRERSAELVDSERRHRMLVEGVQDYAIIMLDAEGRITTWNAGAERIKGYSAAEILGRHFSVFYTEDAVAKGHPETELRAAIAQGRYQEEGWRVRKDKSLFWASVLITSIRDADGKVTAFSKVTRDLTEQKRAERLLISERERAEDASRAKSNFLATMSHEIRTPMNAILGMADLLWETELTHVQRDYVGRFRRAGTNLLALLNDILDLSKIESGRFELEAVDFSLREVVEGAVELMTPRARSKHIELAWRIAPGTPSALTGDPTRLQQILNNIVGNAVKFTETGTVSLTVGNHEDGLPGHLRFEIWDTGVGIPPGKLEAIFEDFTQAESSTSRRFGGTGLGLGICRRLVNRMGGDLTVKSVLGRGSTFVFDVHLGVAAEAPKGYLKEAANFAGCRVLVVDDNATDRLILREMCAGWGMAVAEAATANDARQLAHEASLKQNPFQLALLDHVVPGAERFFLLRELLEINPDLRVVVISSDSQPGDVTKAKALGAENYAVKPIRGPELLGLIAKALGGAADDSRFASRPRFQASPGTRAATSKMSILVAEDSEDNRFLVAAFMEDSPVEITFAENGQQALELFRDRSFDLILMDMQMPVMDGLAATAAIRALERERSANPVPIIAVTANARVEDAERSQAAGCDAHLSKPISRERLIAAVESFCRGSSAHPSHESDEQVESSVTLAELSRKYIAARRDEIARLFELPLAQSLEELRMFGHNLKGNGASFGFPELTYLGAAIEAAASMADMAQLSDRLSKAKAYIEQASGVLA